VRPHRFWSVLLLVACSGGTDLPTERHDTGAAAPDAATPVPADSSAPPDLRADAAAPDAPAPDAPASDAPAPDARADTHALDRAPDWPPCGHVDDRCCPDLSCVDAETVCVGNDPDTALCKRCGRSIGSTNLPCCPGNQCLDGSCCFHAQTPNVGPFCVGVGAICFDVDSRCTASGSCGPDCGGLGQRCCQGLGVAYCGASGTACMRAPGAAAPSCVACGKAGQPCCQQVASPFSIQPCAVGLRCRPLDVGDRCAP
jgi:hypothetical protein